MNKIILIFLFINIGYKAEAQSSALQLADSLYLNGNYSKSIEAYLQYENTSEIYDKIAKAYVALGNYDEALLNYEKSVEEIPDNTLIKLEYAKLLSRVKKYDKASETFNQLIAIDSLNPNYYYELGLNLEKTRDTTARDQFKKAFKLDETHQKAIYKIARRHLVKRRYDSVSYYTDKGLKWYTNNKELISLRAQNYYWKEDYLEASKWFEKLIALNEKTLFVHEKLSFCYSKIYENKKAIEHGLLALKIDPKNATNLFIQGQLYEKQAQYSNKQENYKNAEKYIKEALLILDKPLHYEYATLASIHSIQKKYKEAIDYYKIAIREKPNDDFTHFRLLLVKEKYYKDIDAKIKAYEDFIARFPKSKIKDYAQSNLVKLREEKFFESEEKKD